MPVTLLHESEATPDNGEVGFVNESTGDLTLEATAIQDFLQHVDFASALKLEGIDALFIAGTEKVLDENGDETDTTVAVEMIPGAVVAQLIDHEDLAASLDAYAEMLAERAHEGTLEDRVRAHALLNALGFAPVDENGDELDEAKKKQTIRVPYKKGAFKKLNKQGGAMRNRAVRSMIAMLKKGVIKRAKGGGYTKDKGYKKGGTPAGKKAYAVYSGKNAAKIKQSAKKALSASTDLDMELNLLGEAPEFGLALPFGNALFTVAVAETASDTVHAFVKSMEGKVGKAGYAAMRKNVGESVESKMPKKSTRPSQMMSQQAISEAASNTRPSRLVEGAALAGAMLKSMGGK